MSTLPVQVACPSINVAPTTFTTAAAAAVKNAGLTLASTTGSADFNPYANLGHFWLAAYIFEVRIGLLQQVCLMKADG